MTAQEQVEIVQRRERALFDMERSLFSINTNRRRGSIKIINNDFCGICKKMAESGIKKGISNE